MEEEAEYEQCTKEELIQIIRELKETIGTLRKEIDGSKPKVAKNSTNSSIPTSKELIPRTKSQREKSGKKPGGQVGHKGSHRERNPEPNAQILGASQSVSTLRSLLGRGGRKRGTNRPGCARVWDQGLDLHFHGFS